MRWHRVRQAVGRWRLVLELRTCRGHDTAYAGGAVDDIGDVKAGALDLILKERMFPRRS